MGRVRRLFEQVYSTALEREIDEPPTHVAVIQDGNRRFAKRQGQPAPQGHRAGAQTTEQILEWCHELGIEELTLYAFSTENFDRPREELEPLFDLVTEKLYEFADADEIDEQEVSIKAIGDIDRLPTRVREAVEYAESRTEAYDRFRLNVALAYGGRSELLTAAQEIAEAVAAGDLEPQDIDTQTVDRCLYGSEIRNVDLIIRTGGNERTSNFLPWHANGNEAAVVFKSPYWPEFNKIDFLRAIRTYQYRERDWEQTKLRRAIDIVRSFGDLELGEARRIITAEQRERTPTEASKKAPGSLSELTESRSGSPETTD